MHHRGGTLTTFLVPCWAYMLKDNLNWICFRCIRPLMLIHRSLAGDYIKEVFGPGGVRRHSAQGILPILARKCLFPLPLTTHPSCINPPRYLVIFMWWIEHWLVLFVSLCIAESPQEDYEWISYLNLWHSVFRWSDMVMIYRFFWSYIEKPREIYVTYAEKNIIHLEARGRRISLT